MTNNNLFEDFEEMESAKETLEKSGLVNVVNYLNSHFNSKDVRNMCKGMNTEHRLLQEYFARFCMAYLHMIANNETDLRNEYSVAVAKKLKPILDKEDTFF